MGTTDFQYWKDHSCLTEQQLTKLSTWVQPTSNIGKITLTEQQLKKSGHKYWKDHSSLTEQQLTKLSAWVQPTSNVSNMAVVKFRRGERSQSPHNTPTAKWAANTNVSMWIVVFLFDSVRLPHLPHSDSGVFSLITLTLLPPVTVVFSRV